MSNLAFLHLMMPSAAGASGQPNPLTTFGPLVLIFVIFYFFMIRPQMKRQKELNSYRSALKRGDKVVTTGGIYGKVYEVKDNYIMIEVGGDVKLKVDKNAVLKDTTADS
jgi:preprotein translocase subunit YajC